MPGPISDSFDVEFGTGENADRLEEQLLLLAKKLCFLGERKYIINVIDGEPGPTTQMTFTEQQLRLIRFALEYTADVI